jgi:hypothetical protein
MMREEPESVTAPVLTKRVWKEGTLEGLVERLTVRLPDVTATFIDEDPIGTT